jgi:hypothetical protein
VYEVTNRAGEGVRIFDGRGRLMARVVEHRLATGGRRWRVDDDPTLHMTADAALLAFVRWLTARRKER